MNVAKKTLTVGDIVSLVTALICGIVAIAVFRDFGDIYYMIPTGNDILENGIPSTNQFFVQDGLPIVIQQWLYCVYCAILDKLGLFGFEVSILVIASGIFAVMYSLFRMTDVPKVIAVLSSALAIASCSSYMLNPRPEALTVLLLMMQIIILELYKRTGSKIILYLLPFLTLLHINFHGSMWAFHFAVMIPYFLGVPEVMLNNGESALRFSKCWKDFIFPVVLMALSLFCNPYGVDGVLYLFDSVFSDTFDLVVVTEMQSPMILTITGIQVLIVLVAYSILLGKRWLSSVSFYMGAGFIGLTLVSIRNSAFLPIATFFVLRDLWANIDITSLLAKSVRGSYAIVDSIRAILIAVELLIVGVITISPLLLDISLHDNALSKQDKPGYISLVETLNEKDVSKDTPIFAFFELGSYLEYQGYCRIFMDSRPELYNQKLNETDERTVLGEYMYFRDCKDDDWTEFMEKYEFQYAISSQSLGSMHTYLKHSDDWVCLDTSGDYYLFERVTA